MTGDGQDARPIDPNQPAAFNAEEIERLIRFIRVLNEWARHEHDRGFPGRDQDLTIACAVRPGTEPSKPVPIRSE